MIQATLQGHQNDFPAFNLSGALAGSGREFIGDSRERAVTGEHEFRVSRQFWRQFLISDYFQPSPLNQHPNQ